MQLVVADKQMYICREWIFFNQSPLSQDSLKLLNSRMA